MSPIGLALASFRLSATAALHHRNLSGCALLGLLLLFIHSVHAEDATPTPTPTEAQPTIQTLGTKGALRLAAYNGVVKYVNNTRQIDIEPRADLLPGPRSLTSPYPPSNIVNFRVRNDELNKPKAWKLNAKDKEIVKAALYLTGNQLDKDTFDLAALDASDTGFQKSFKGAEGAKLASLVGSNSGQYIATQIEHYAISFLLASGGISYTLNADPDQVTIDAGGTAKYRGLPYVSRPDSFNWDITVYEYDMSPGLVETATVKKLKFYRFSARPRMPRVSVLLQDPADTKIDMSGEINWIPTAVTIGIEKGLFRGAGSFEVPVSDENKTKLKELTNESGQSKVDILFDFVGGIDVGDVITKGLFGGTEKATLVTGGLVGKGEITQVYGMNQELKQFGSSTLGLFTGVSPGSNDSLLIGPSIQTSVLTAAVVANIRERDSSGGGKRTGTDLAGVVAVDVSRLIGARKPKQLTLKNAVSEGTLIGTSIEDFIDKSAVIKFNVQRADGKTAGFALLRVDDAGKPLDAEGKPVEDASKQARFSVGIGEKQFVLPKGKYKIEIDENFRLFEKFDDGISSNIPVPLDAVLDFENTSAVETIAYDIKPKP